MPADKIEVKTNSSKWEAIDDTAVASTERLKVPGGWIYHIGHKMARQIVVCFVPEPERCPDHNNYLVRTCYDCDRLRDNNKWKKPNVIPPT